MRDNYGREINYLRISVTQKCNLNCLYCGVEGPDLNELTADEIRKAVTAFAGCGINKIRLTGGEPLMRGDIVKIAEVISKIDGIQKLVLTTNGVRLKTFAEALKNAGVGAVNVSLDTLNPEGYRKITGKDCLSDVLEGIEKAESVGLKVRTNAVLIRGQNDNEAENLINLAKFSKIDVRFIELMPFSDMGKNESLIVRGDEILRRFPFLKPVKPQNGDIQPSVAGYYEADGFLGQIGFINPVSDKFCDKCNRIRLLSDGKIKMCLGHEETVDIRPFLNNPEELHRKIQTAIVNKPKGHEFNCGYGNNHAMNKIGG